MRTLGIIAFVAAATVGCTSGSDPGVNATNAVATDLAAPKPDTQPPATSASATSGATTTTTVPDVFGSGIYIVGTDIQPGTYRVFGYWARLDDARKIIDGDAVYDNGVGLLNVAPTDSYVEISGGAHTLASSGILNPVADGFTAGTYLVNWDIRPGRYRLSAIDGSANYQVLDATGSIVRSTTTAGDTIVMVAASDWALSFRGVISPA